MNKLVSKIIDSSVSYGLMEEKDRDIYTIAITSLFFSLMTWGTLIIMGVIFKEVFGCFLFLIYHIPLRIYAGGFHQKTRVKCYIQSLIIFILLLFGSGYVYWIDKYWILLSLVSFAVIYCLAPVEAMNKPLNSEERKHHKTAARIILFIELTGIVIFKIFDFNSGLYYSLMSVQLVTVQLLTGYIEQKLSSKNVIRPC